MDIFAEAIAATLSLPAGEDKAIANCYVSEMRAAVRRGDLASARRTAGNILNMINR